MPKVPMEVRCGEGCPAPHWGKDLGRGTTEEVALPEIFFVFDFKMNFVVF